MTNIKNLEERIFGSLVPDEAFDGIETAATEAAFDGTETAATEASHLPPLDDGPTWASDEAPWVGAETRWRASMLPEPHATAHVEDVQPETAFRISVYENLSISEDEAKYLQTVTSTYMPKAPPEDREASTARPRRTGWSVSHFAVALVAIGVTWSWFQAPQLYRNIAPGAAALSAPHDNDSDLNARAMPRHAVASPWVSAGLVPLAAWPQSQAEDSALVDEMVFDIEEFSESAVHRRHHRHRHTDETEVSSDAPQRAEPVVTAAAPVSPAADAKPAASSDAAKKLSAMLDNPQAKAQSAQAVIPQAPSRSEIVRSMDKMVPTARRCGAAASGRVVVELRIAGDTGRVVSARAVDDNFAGTAVGRCVARAAENAVFPRFAKPALTIKYPYDI